METILNIILTILQIGINITGWVGCFQMKSPAASRYALGMILTGLSCIACFAYLGIWNPPIARFGLNEGITYTFLSGFVLLIIVRRIPPKTDKKP
ncbi:MAG: hypothetical protein KatS3mg020_0492 [Fimbriimonadales bacterium]|nr:MAG: hypothetical protein KatS3mg020_0492 [Fimbriimonadales bacterium]